MWRWTRERDHLHRWRKAWGIRGKRVCNYCGSLHPDDLVELLRERPDTRLVARRVVRSCDEGVWNVIVPGPKGARATFMVEHHNGMSRDALSRLDQRARLARSGCARRRAISFRI